MNAATPYSDKTYSQCPFCGAWRAVRKDGSLWQHMGFTPEGVWTSKCAGSGHKS